MIYDAAPIITILWPFLLIGVAVLLIGIIVAIAIIAHRKKK